MKIFKKKVIHEHRFSAWMVASKGISGAFNGNITVGSIQYKKCKTKSCQYIVAEIIL